MLKLAGATEHHHKQYNELLGLYRKTTVQA